MHWKVNDIMNKLALPLVVIFFLVIFFMVRGTSPAEAPESIKGVRIGGQDIKVELAISPEDQAQGLSGRMPLKEDEGMLFIFETPGKNYFWMKGMNFAIDMIWIGEDRKIIYIKKDAKPEKFLETYGPEADSKYVLEVLSGFSDKYGLKEGDEVIFKY